MSTSVSNPLPPIFIAGCGRSGTTYLQTIVDAHPAVFIPTETLFIPQYLRDAHFVPKRLRKWLYYHEPHLKAWYEGPEFPVDNIAATIAACHLHAANAEGKSIWGQKTPRFVRYIDLFQRAYPGCKWILIYRDPRATVASMLNSPVHPYSIGWAAARWVRDNQPVIEHLKNPRPDTLVVCYEDLIRDFDNHLRRIFSFLNLDELNRAQVEQTGKVRDFKGTTFSIPANNVRNGLAPQLKSIDSWKKSLSEGQVRQIERRCATTMQQLGYEPLPPGPTGLKLRKAEWFWSAWSVLQNGMILLRYLRHWPYFLVHTFIRKIVFDVCRIFGKSDEASPPNASDQSVRTTATTNQPSESASKVNSASASGDLPLTRGRKSHLRLMLRLALALIFITVFVALGRKYFDELHRLRHAKLSAILLMVLVFIPTRLMTSEIMRLGLRALGHHISTGEAFLVSVVNAYANLLLPRAGLGLPALYMKLKHRVPIADFSSVQLVPMTMLQITTIGMAGLSCLTILRFFFNQPWRLPFVVLFGAMLVGSLLVMILQVGVPIRWQNRVAMFLRRLSESWLRLGRSGHTISTSIALHSLIVIFRAIRLHLAFWALGQPVNFFAVFTGSLLMDTAFFISITPSALGFKEVGLVLAAPILGTTPDLCLAVALLDRIVCSIVILLIGQFGMWRMIKPVFLEARLPVSVDLPPLPQIGGAS